MRKNRNAEQAYISQLVGKTKALVSNENVAVIAKLASGHDSRERA